MKHIPVACTLDTAAMARRQEELRAGVLSLCSKVESLPDGIRWEFPASADLLSRLGAVLDAERLCCRFLRVVITAEPDGGLTAVEVTGPPGTAELLAEWLPEGMRP